jgi:PAS domain S-box-containing protein
MIDLTDPRRAEHTLRASEMRNRPLLERNMAGVLRTGVDGTVLELNDAVARILGFGSREALLGRGAKDFYYRPADRAIMLDRLLSEGGLSNYELCLRHQDGSPVWVLANIVLHEEPSGADVVQSTIIDITERKRTEDALLLFRALIDRSNDGIEVIDPETGRFLDVNETACLAHGYTRDEYLTLSVRDIAPTSDPAAWARNVEQLRRLGSRLHVGLHRRKDGSTFPVEVNITYVRLNRDYIVAVVRDVTERRRAEEELQRTANLLRAVANETTDAVFVKDRNGKYLLMNEAAARFVGKSVAKVVGKDDTELFDPDGARRLMERDRQVMESGRAEMFEEVVTAAGVTRAFQSTKAPYRDGAGNVIGLVGISREITERKRAEEAVRKSEERLRQAVRVSHLGIFEHDHLTEAVYWSPEERAIHGWEAERAPTLSEFVAMLHPEDRERIAAAIRGAHEPAGDGKFDVEQRIIRPNGEVRWLVTRAQTVFEGVGDARHPVRTVGAVLDVTEWKRVEERLAEAQEIGGFGSFEIDVTTWVGHCSPALRRILGQTEEPCQDFPAFLHRHLHADDPEWTDRARARLLEEGRSDGIEFRYLRPDGQERVLHLRRRALRTLAGRVTRIVGTIQDVTELKRLEEQFLQAQKMEAVGRLAGGVAHDFNNLLTVINGLSELVAQQMRPDDPNRELIAEVLNAGERAATLTRQLLAFGRRQILQPRVLDVNILLGELSKMLRRLLGEHIELRLEADATPGLVKVDPGQFEQAVINLAVNARDAMPAGGRLTITTGSVELNDAYVEQHPDARPGRYVLVAVSDTGHGMDAATHERIFEPFFTTKGPGRGTGLGLAMVYGFVKQSGGHIDAESETGCGTTLRVYLPRADGTVLSTRSPEDLARLPKGTEAILLVEDQDAVRGFARDILLAGGYTVLEARDGEEAIRVAQQCGAPIHLLVTDVVLPHMSGPHLAERLARDRPELRVLFVSGYADELISRSGLQEAGSAFLEKPFSPARLARKVREVLDTDAADRR